MCVSEIRVKQIRVNQGLGVMIILQFPWLVEEVPVRTNHIWFKLQLPH